MCLTCKIIRREADPPGGIIECGRHTVMNHCWDVNIPGYFIISPIRHVTSWQELTTNELVEMAEVARDVAIALEKEPEIERVYLCCAGEETGHIHFHVFPRYIWMCQLSWLGTEGAHLLINGNLDGPGLLSYVRQKMKVHRNEMDAVKITEITNTMRLHFGDSYKTNVQ